MKLNLGSNSAIHILVLDQSLKTSSLVKHDNLLNGAIEREDLMQNVNIHKILHVANCDKQNSVLPFMLLFHVDLTRKKKKNMEQNMEKNMEKKFSYHFILQQFTYRIAAVTHNAPTIQATL